MSDARFDCLEERIKKLEEKMDEVLEVARLGKLAYMAAKVMGWCIAVAVGLLELWRAHK
jgi:hypothetical protein